MAFLAGYDSTVAAPSPVTGWFDTGAFTYPALPSSTVTLSADQWAARMTGLWAVSAGALVAFTPVLTSQQLATRAYGAFVAGGLTVTSTGTPALSGVYAIDSQSQVDIATEAQFISTFTEFTTGATTNLPWPMPSGGVVVFPTTAAFLSFAKAAGQAVAAAKLALFQLAAMPAATATIP